MRKKKAPFYFIMVVSLLALLMVDLAPLFSVDADGVQVEFKKIEDIDVALTVGTTDVEARHFTTGLSDALKARGISPDRVNIQAFESKTTSSETQDASEIFADWDSRNILPNGSTSSLELGTHITGGWIAEGSRVIRDNTGGGRPARAWIIPDDPSVDGSTEISFEWGIDSHRYGSFSHGEAGFIFGVKDDKNFYAYIMDNHSACGHIRMDGGEAIIKVTNGRISILKTYNNFPRYRAGLKQDVKILIDENKVTVEREGVKTIEVTDNATSVIEGRYGFYVWDQYGAYFDNVSFTSEVSREFNEVIRQPEWRDGSNRFIVDMDNNEKEEFDDEHKLGEILTRLSNDKIDYVSVGSNGNKAQSQRLINRNSGNGTFIDGSKQFNQVINEVADYIVSTLDLGNNEEYVLIDEKHELIVSPSSILKNTQTSAYPQGRWSIKHDHGYYENSNGLHDRTGKYFPDFDLDFNKPGRYEVSFEDNNIFPKYIYAHRRPIASYSLGVKELGSQYEVSVNDMSYDLDSETTSDRGIKDREWKWKETTSETWNDGLIPSKVSAEKDYIVQLRVKDHQDVWSNPVSRYVTTVQSPPIADFNMPSKALLYDRVNINNTSYDPAGKQIVRQEWIVIKHGVELYKGSTPMTRFTDYGEGRYSVHLRVQNSSGEWSESFRRVIDINKGKIAPVINVDKETQGWTNQDITVQAQFEDYGGGGIAQQRFGITKQAYVTGEGWNPWNTTRTQETIRVSSEGSNYIHIEAKDRQGNETSKTSGPYRIDKTKPTIEIAPMTDRQPHENVIVNIQARDNLSGVKSVTLPDGTVSNNNNFQYEMEKNGAYTFIVEDYAGNTHTEVYEISTIERILDFSAPYIENGFEIRIQQDMRKNLHVGNMTIRDWRENNTNNWKLHLEASKLNNGDHILPSGVMTIAGIDKVKKVDGDKEGSLTYMNESRIIDDGRIEMISADSERGAYIVSFKDDALKFHFPTNNVRRGVYNTKLTWTLESTPEIE